MDINPATEFTPDDAILSSALSCPDLSQNHYSNRERTNTATKQGERAQGQGVPLYSTNLLLPTPKMVALDSALMSRICKSMSNIDTLSRTKKQSYIQLDKQKNAEVTEEEFFELIERLSENRLPDQRAELPTADTEKNDEKHAANAELLAMIAEIQSRRYDDQRASPVLSENETKEVLRTMSLRTPKEKVDKKVMDDKLYELIMSYQGSRIEEQRSELGAKTEDTSGSGKSSKLQNKDSKKKKASKSSSNQLN